MSEKAKNAETKLEGDGKTLVGLEGLKVLSGRVPVTEVAADKPAPRAPGRPQGPDLRRMEETLLSVERASSAAHDRITEIEKALGEPSPLEEEVRKLKSRVSVLESGGKPAPAKGNGMRYTVGGVGGAVGGAAAWQLVARGVNAVSGADTLGVGWIPTLLGGLGGSLAGLGAAHLTRE